MTTRSQRQQQQKAKKNNDIDFNTEYSGLMLAGKALHLAGDRKRYAQRRELLSLRAKHIPITKNLKQLLASLEKNNSHNHNHNTDDKDAPSSSNTTTTTTTNTNVSFEDQQNDTNLQLYREAVQQVIYNNNDNDNDDDTDLIVSTPEQQQQHNTAIQLQTKLCHALHCHEIQVKQIHSMKRQQKHLVNSVLKKELRILRQGQTEQDLLTQISKLKQEQLRLQQESQQRLQEQQLEIDAVKAMIAEQQQNLDCLLTPQGSTCNSYDGDNDNGSASSLNYWVKDGQEDIGTPKILQKSKIWVDLKEAEEKDADALWEAQKIANKKNYNNNNNNNNTNGLNGSSSHFRSSSSLPNYQQQHSPTPDGKESSSNNSLPMLGTSSHHAREVAGAARQSIIGSILGGIWDVDEDDHNNNDDDDGFACESPTQQQGKSTFGAASSMAAYLTGVQEEEPLSPTSAALRDLTDEVFSY